MYIYYKISYFPLIVSMLLWMYNTVYIYTWPDGGLQNSAQRCDPQQFYYTFDKNVVSTKVILLFHMQCANWIYSSNPHIG
jgi:hypothetical protein